MTSGVDREIGYNTTYLDHMVHYHRVNVSENANLTLPVPRFIYQERLAQTVVT